MSPDLSTKTASSSSFYKDVGLYGALRRNPKYALFTHLVEKANLVHDIATDHHGSLLVFPGSVLPDEIQKRYRDLDPHECAMVVQAHIIASNKPSGKYLIYTPLSGQKMVIEIKGNKILYGDREISMVHIGQYDNGALYEIDRPFV